MYRYMQNLLTWSKYSIRRVSLDALAISFWSDPDHLKDTRAFIFSIGIESAQSIISPGKKKEKRGRLELFESKRELMSYLIVLKVQSIKPEIAFASASLEK